MNNEKALADLRQFVKTNLSAVCKEYQEYHDTGILPSGSIIIDQIYLLTPFSSPVQMVLREITNAAVNFVINATTIHSHKPAETKPVSDFPDVVPRLRRHVHDEEDCLLTIDEWIDDCKAFMFIDDDGIGYLATETGVSIVTVRPSMVVKKNRDFPAWATHIVWHNK